MALGRKTVHKLGKRLREAYGDGTGCVLAEDLEMLQEYRLEYRETINTVFNIIFAESHKIDSKCIVTYRIKRIISIIRKLQRFEKTALDQMIDIAGCRCIMQNTDQVYRLLEVIKNSPKIEITQIKDYIKKTQAEGYRSLHVYVRLKDGNGQEVEIQLRDIEQHNWATLVEISDVIHKTQLKEYSQPADLLEFHRILSLREADWTADERNHYFDMLEKYKYAEKLQEVFLKNIRMRYQWMSNKASGLNKFFLIETDENLFAKINSFRSFHDAENAYFERFKENPNSNLVLTQIQNVNFEKISTAYSNYVLSAHKFMSDCMNRYTAEIKFALQQKDFNRYARALRQYYETVTQQVIQIKNELMGIGWSKYPIRVQTHKTNEWTRDLKSKIIDLEKRKQEMSQIYKDSLDGKSFFYLRVSVFTANLARQYDERLKKM